MRGAHGTRSSSSSAALSLEVSGTDGLGPDLPSYDFSVAAMRSELQGLLVPGSGEMSDCSASASCGTAAPSAEPGRPSLEWLGCSPTESSVKLDDETLGMHIGTEFSSLSAPAAPHSSSSSSSCSCSCSCSSSRSTLW